MRFKLSKKALLTSQSFASCAILIGIIVMLNLLSAQQFFRFDATADHEYTISKATKTLLREVDDLVTIKVFFSHKLPPDFAPLSQYVRDLLDEYTAVARGNLQILYIDPATDPKVAEEVMGLGIPKIQMNIISKDEQKAVEGYLGIGIFYVNKTEIIPVVQNTSKLEYDLTSKIRKVTAKEIPTIGFLTGHDEHADYSFFQKSLEENYTVSPVDLNAEQPLESIDTLVVGGPKKALLEREIFEIDQFLVSGGNVIFLLDAVNAGEGLMAETVDAGLADFLANFGVSIEKNLIMDAVYEYATFSQGWMSFTLPYPLWPKLVTFSKDNPMSSGMESLVLPWSSSLTIASTPTVPVASLAKTTEKGWAQSENFTLDPNQAFSIPSNAKTYDMVAFAKGKFTSYFAGKPIPAKAPVATTVSVPPVSAVAPSEFHESGDAEGRIIVMGDSDFAADGFLRIFPQNLTFALNMADALTLDDSLIEIRSKGASDRPLVPLSDQTRVVLKFLGILGMPLAVILFGIVYLVVRKRKSVSYF